MMLRRAAMKLLGALTLAVGLGAAGEANAAEVIKIGTLAPAASPWGQVFKVWAEAVSKKSEGRVELQFFYNGQQGDEAAMVGKMKAGQLDGAAITAVGLSKIYQPILALQLPGALTSWDTLEKAQSELKGDFEKGVSDAGFTLLGWGNVGQAHFFTKGDAVKTPDGLKGRKPYMWRDDKISPVFYQVVGGVTPVPLNVPEVLANLKTGSVDTLNAPSLAVEQLQWGGELATITTDVTGCAIGAVVMSSKRVSALPEDLRKIMIETGAVAAKALGQKVKDEDAAAFGRLKGKLKVIELSADEKKAWAAKFKETRKKLAQGTFDPKLVEKIEKIAGL